MWNFEEDEEREEEVMCLSNWEGMNGRKKTHYFVT